MIFTNVWSVMVLLYTITTLKSDDVAPTNCHCFNATNNYRTGCNTPGCSVGNNTCQNSYAFGLFNASDPLGRADHDAYYGCNCPSNPYSHKPGMNTNGRYSYNNPAGGSSGNYNYTTCQTFGYNATDSGNDPVINRDGAAACCTYCCSLDLGGGD